MNRKDKNAVIEYEIRPIGSNSHDSITSITSGSAAANICHDRAVELGIPHGVYCNGELLMWSQGSINLPLLGIVPIH